MILQLGIQSSMGQIQMDLVGSKDSSDSDTSSSSNSGLFSEAENKLDSMEYDISPAYATQYPLQPQWVHAAIDKIYSARYKVSRNEMPRGPAYLPHVLGEMKDKRPDLFRTELRVSPLTFDKLVEKIYDDPVFTNDSHNAQLPIENQLTITLFGLGHYGNASSLQ